MKRYFCCILLIFITLDFAKALQLRERVYVQTDKNLYLAGEPIQMKLLTTDSELIPLVFSKVAYVELVDDSLARLQIKIELTNGTGAGQMILPVDLPTGYYRLIAYTQFMRNEGVDVFFEKNIAVLNTFQSGYQPAEEEYNEENNLRSEISNFKLQTDKTTYTTRTSGELILNDLPGNIHTLSVSIAGKELVPVTRSDIALFQENRTKQAGGNATQQLRTLDSLLLVLQSVDNNSLNTVADLEQLMSNELKRINEILTNQESGISTRQMRFFPEYEGHIITGKIVENQIGQVTNQIEQVTNEIRRLRILDSLLQAQQSSDLEQFVSDERRRISENLTNLESLLYSNNEILLTNFIVIAFPTDNGIRVFAGQNYGTGDVRFFTSGISGTKEIATVVYSADEKYKVEIQSPFVNRYASKQMPALYIDTAYYGQALARSVALQVFRYFSDNLSENQNIPEPHFKMEPTWSYPLDEYTRFTTMREVFIEFIIGARFRRNPGNGKQELQVLVTSGGRSVYGTMPLVLLDGVPVADHDAIFNYDPLLVQQINIYYGPFMMGGYHFDGIIELLTYRGLHQDLNLNRSSQIIEYEGPQLLNRSDTPYYSEEKNRNSRMPDARHTLLWNPDVQTDRKTSIRLPFDTSDLTGEFQATVKGVTKDGKIIFATTFFRVE